MVHGNREYIGESASEIPGRYHLFQLSVRSLDSAKARERLNYGLNRVLSQISYRYFWVYLRRSAPEVLDAKRNISSQKDSLYPNKTLKIMSTVNSDAHILGQILKNSANSGSRDPEFPGFFTLRNPRTTQIMVPKTKALGIFYVEKPKNNANNGC